MEKSKTAEPMASSNQGSFGTTKSRFVLLHGHTMQNVKTSNQMGNLCMSRPISIATNFGCLSPKPSGGSCHQFVRPVTLLLHANTVIADIFHKHNLFAADQEWEQCQILTELLCSA